MTRLDNDDALAIGAVERIQSWVRKVKNGVYVIDMPCGVMWDKENGKAYLAKHSRGSPFITLVEDTDRKGGMLTVYWHCHNKVASHDDIFYTPKDYPGWLMTIHEKNCTNRIFEEMIVGDFDEKKLGELFGI